MANAKEEAIALERRFWDESSNPKLFEESMTDDAITIFEPMGFIDKKQAVEMSGQSEGWKDVQIHDMKAIELTPDAVALAYHGQARRGKSGELYRGSINSVYVKRNGHWQLAMTSHQPWNPEV